jgi:tetratricopeptide (TPR) repeat protein
MIPQSGVLTMRDYQVHFAALYRKGHRLNVRISNALRVFLVALWKSIPSYLPFYLIVLVAGYAAYHGSQEVTIISPFHLPPDNKERQLPFSGETVANELRDALTSIRGEAEGQRLQDPCKADAPKEESSGGLNPRYGNIVQVRGGTFDVEVKGISIDALVAEGREVLGKAHAISGDIIFVGSDSFKMIARDEDGHTWTVPSGLKRGYLLSDDTLGIASCQLAEAILEATNRRVLAAALLHRGEFERVIKLYQDLPTDLRDRADALNDIGIAWREIGKPDLAEAAFKNATAVRPNSPETWYNRAIGLSRVGNSKEAVEFYKKAVELKADFAEARYGLALELTNEGNFQEAMTENRKAIALKPESAAMHYGCGNTLVEMGENNEAINEFRKALELRPDFAYAHEGLGTALEGEGKYEEAISEHQTAIQLASSASDKANRRSNLARAYAEGGRVDIAISEYQKVIGSDEQYSYAYSGLGNALWRKGDFDSAFRAYSRILQLKPDFPHAYEIAYTGLGDALCSKHLFDDAISEYKMAIKMDSGYEPAYAGLGKVWEGKGQYEEAVRAYNKALNLNADDRRTRELLNAVMRKIDSSKP